MRTAARERGLSLGAHIERLEIKSNSIEGNRTKSFDSVRFSSVIERNRIEKSVNVSEIEAT